MPKTFSPSTVTIPKIVKRLDKRYVARGIQASKVEFARIFSNFPIHDDIELSQQFQRNFPEFASGLKPMPKRIQELNNAENKKVVYTILKLHSCAKRGSFNRNESVPKKRNKQSYLFHKKTYLPFSPLVFNKNYLKDASSTPENDNGNLNENRLLRIRIISAMKSVFGENNILFDPECFKILGGRCSEKYLRYIFLLIKESLIRNFDDYINSPIISGDYHFFNDGYLKEEISKFLNLIKKNSYRLQFTDFSGMKYINNRKIILPGLAEKFLAALFVSDAAHIMLSLFDNTDGSEVLKKGRIMKLNCLGGITSPDQVNMLQIKNIMKVIDFTRKRIIAENPETIEKDVLKNKSFYYFVSNVHLNDVTFGDDLKEYQYEVEFFNDCHELPPYLEYYGHESLNTNEKLYKCSSTNSLCIITNEDELVEKCKMKRNILYGERLCNTIDQFDIEKKDDEEIQIINFLPHCNIYKQGRFHTIPVDGLFIKKDGMYLIQHEVEIYFENYLGSDLTALFRFCHDNNLTNCIIYNFGPVAMFRGNCTRAIKKIINIFNKHDNGYSKYDADVSSTKVVCVREAKYQTSSRGVVRINPKEPWKLYGDNE
uniref:AAA domain-containing protein n=1 Tax=Parastrongyloides trichosuri TaxID=131310 RepID=A0A0N5A733_PARTI